MSALALYQMVAVLLLATGFYGLLWRRSLVGMLICVELLLNGAGLSLVAAAQLTPAKAVLGQLGTMLIMGLAAAEATLVLAIVIVVVRNFNSADSDAVAELRG